MMRTSGEPPPAEPAPPNQGGLMSTIRTIVSRLSILYILGVIFHSFTGKSSSPAVVPTGGLRFKPASNIFPPGQLFDVFFFLHDTENSDELSMDMLFSRRVLLEFDDWTSGPNEDGSHMFHSSMNTPNALLNNGSLYLHVFVGKTGVPPLPYSNKSIQAIWTVRPLNKYRRRYHKRTRNLLSGSAATPLDKNTDEQPKFEIINYWHPNITINIVYDHTKWTLGEIPQPLDKMVKFAEDGGNYYPITFFNDYWNLASDYAPVNESVAELSLSITFQPVSFLKFQFLATQLMKDQFAEKSVFGSLATESDDDAQDSLKRALLETNPILLGVTVVVSILHMVFEFLAFKNDVAFWKEREDLKGLSVKTVLFNVFQTVVVFLYVLDNDTNMMVRLSLGVGLLIETWKITKVLHVQILTDDLWFGMIPRVKFSDKGNYVESDTKTYDELAFRYLSWLFFPLLVGYAVYSLVYEEQKGWYSWILSTVYGFLLTFGFIAMTPQLFINYKLKSVAHLPWRMLTYKFINTFIDDLFAFVINTPTMYRLSCFRDDLVFLVYLYQRWAYRVDPTRTNEFGSSLSEAEKSTVPISGGPVEVKRPSTSPIKDKLD